MSNKTQLQTNNASLDGYISRIQAAKEVAATLPEAGGVVELPDLTNEGSTSDLLSGKELIDQEGKIITGSMSNNGTITSTMDGINIKSVSIPEGYTSGGTVSLDNTIDNEVNDQADLIAQIKSVVDNLPEAGGAEVSGTIIIEYNGTHDVATYANAEVCVALNLSNLTVTPTKSTQTFWSAPGELDGYELVTVNPIPDEYIIPSGARSITENGTHDVTQYAFVNVSVPTGGGSGGSNETYHRLIEEGVLSDSEMTEVPNDFCRGWYYINKINFPNATKVGSYVFYNCANLTEASMPNCTELGGYSFYNCAKLTSVNCANIASIGGSVFRGCALLTSLTFLEATSIGTYGFRACAALERIDFSKLSSIGNNAFLESSALVTVIIRTNRVCTLSNKNAFSSTPIESGTGYIYVPSALVDSYKSATNWATYANQIRAIEDYPEICG